MTALAEDTDLRTLSLERFAAALAEATPTPGGSSAAALPAALAAGLVAMAARLGVECDPFSGVAFELEDVAEEADRLRTELLDLVDEDAAAFERVMAARRTGRDVQTAYGSAVDPPLRACALSLRVLELAADVGKRGNPRTAVDAGVAAVLAAASVEAAALSVETELEPVDDESFREARLHAVRVAREHAARLR